MIPIFLLIKHFLKKFNYNFPKKKRNKIETPISTPGLIKQVILLEIKKSKFDEVKEIISQIANLNKKLMDLGVVKSVDNIISDYAKWFCSKKFSLKLCNNKNLRYDALSKYGKKIQIKSILGSEIDFKTNIDGIKLEEIVVLC